MDRPRRRALGCRNTHNTYRNPANIASAWAKTNVVTAEDVVLKHGETLEVNLNLAIDPHGSLTLDLRPRDARVEIIDGNKTYKPGVRLPMVNTQSRSVAVATSTKQSASTLNMATTASGWPWPEVSVLNVKTSPADSLIDVSYNSTMSEPYQPNMRLPAGKVTVSVRAMGYRTKTRTIDLKPPGQALEVGLKKPTEPGAEITDQLKAGGTGPVMWSYLRGNLIWAALAVANQNNPSAVYN